MRGRPETINVDDAGLRNTPAYAGKTMLSVADAMANEKHPRVYGEDS